VLESDMRTAQSAAIPTSHRGSGVTRKKRLPSAAVTTAPVRTPTPNAAETSPSFRPRYTAPAV